MRTAVGRNAPQRLIAAAVVMFATLAAFLASGGTAAAVRAAPLALTAPDFDAAFASNGFRPTLDGADTHAAVPVAGAPSAGPDALAPEYWAGCTCPAPRATRPDYAGDPALSQHRSLVIARAPPRQG